MFTVKCLNLFDALLCQFMLGVKCKNSLVCSKSIFIDRRQVTPGEEMRLGFFKQLGKVLFLMSLFLVGQPDAANGFLGLLEIQTVFPYGRILPEGRLMLIR